MIDYVLPVLTTLAFFFAMQDGKPHLQRFSPIMGLLSQPIWFTIAVEQESAGQFINASLVTVVFIYGIYNYWIKEK